MHFTPYLAPHSQWAKIHLQLNLSPDEGAELVNVRNTDSKFTAKRTHIDAAIGIHQKSDRQREPAYRQKIKILLGHHLDIPSQFSAR